ncbi:hypothetical protein B7494_g88 [Chlorociboria aeruginascens]|nr:hypothetical protein B7494_g88 [Chlorociboria aeruginascens]
MAPSALNPSPTDTPAVGEFSNGLPTKNGHSNGTSFTPYHTASFSSLSPDETLDLLCIGFGPASLAIAIALNDVYKSSPACKPPKALFLEKQPQFGWHSGMQLPGTKMQICFLKDLATPRDPRSHFTFLNYVHQKGRLNQFMNLGTFLPARLEYEDYLRWCASHFDSQGQFADTIAKIQEREVGRQLRFAVVGGGQSAAEIFNDLWSRFPDAEVKLIIKGASLRPSDDSPFVNEIFNHDRVDGVYNATSSSRASAIALDRATNYGVVRLDLLENLYGKLYMQRLRHSDEKQWRCRILHNRKIISTKQGNDSSVLLRLGMNGDKISGGDEQEEDLEVDYVFTATGYVRNVHESLLTDLGDLLGERTGENGKIPVNRDYRIPYDEEKVDSKRAGVWLQGCNEATHGLSDTLLSILAIRGGELVQSIFGEELSSTKSL